jgi:hypothetical protein
MDYKFGQGLKEMNIHRIFERKIVQKLYEPVKEPWIIRTNKGVKDILQGKDIVIFTKSLHLRLYSQVKRMQKHDLPQQIAVGSVEGTR